MKRILYICYFLACNIQLFSQTMGFNIDLSKQALGVRPYEMKADIRKSNIDFTDCQKWIIESSGCSANLYRSQDQIIASNYSGKLVYSSNQKGNVSIFLRLKTPISISPNWNSMDMWAYGDSWSWIPSSNLSMDLYAVFDDMKGNKDYIYLSKLYYEYWFLNHTRISPLKNIHFIGLLLKNDIADIGKSHTIYLNSIYFYKENTTSLTIKNFPNKLPFPLHKRTILPTIKSSNYKNYLIRKDNSYEFQFRGKDESITYKLLNKDIFGNLSVYFNNKFIYSLSNRKIILDDNTTANFVIQNMRIKSDTLFCNCNVSYKNRDVPFKIWYTIHQKSLIVGIKELNDNGIVKEMNIGTISYSDGKCLKIPFLKYNYNYNNRPCIFYTKGLFSFMIFDWYSTNASKWISGNQPNGIFAGDKVVYTAKTNGNKNPLNEKLFINVSPDVQEIFPNIDNPISPMKNRFSDRLYAVAQSSNLDSLKRRYTDYRRKGIDKIFVRSHEEFWRKGGESFTFKVTPNPDLGTQTIKTFISFVKDLGWKFSLYTNYCDFATVSSRWDPNWVIRLSDENWQKSWTRCYAAKPQIAWEQEALLAPQIHKIFNTDFSYCDVQTAVSPMDREDYDNRVSDAAMMKSTYNRYGMLLMNERKAYDGPVFSEGGSHWWYAGLVDGNYANDDLLHLPIFPDFCLIKIHPLEMDFAEFGIGYQYIAYALAYGNVGMLSGNDAIKRYAMLQPIQNNYITSTVKLIKYCNNGKEYNASDAIKKEMLQSPRLHITYDSGLQMYINFNDSNWNITIGHTNYILPQYGFVVYNPLNGLKSISVISPQSNDRCDQVYSSYLYYLDTHDKAINGELGGKGSYILKKEEKGWEIIPLENKTSFNFDLSLLKLSNQNVTVECLTDDGRSMNKTIGIFKNKIVFENQPTVYKYRITVLK